MPNRPLPLPQGALSSSPSELEFGGVFRGSHGINESVPIVVAPETDFEFLFPRATTHIVPSAAADGDPQIMGIWPEQDRDLASPRIPRAANFQFIRDLVTIPSVSAYEVSFPKKLSPEFQDKCRKAILDLLDTAGKQNWDGENADPVLGDTVEAALNIVQELSGDIAPPEISADPEGNIEFDWHLDNGTMFTVSIGPIGDIAISGLLPGKSKFTGLVEDRGGDDFSFLQCGLKWLSKMQERE